MSSSTAAKPSVPKAPRASSKPRTTAAVAPAAAAAACDAAAHDEQVVPAIVYRTPANRAEAAKWHGYALADEMLPLPHCVVACEDKARPNYTDIKAAEYCDSPEVLERKADKLIEMFRAARNRMIYAGAGISTSSGIWDYASNAKGSTVQATKRALTGAFICSLQPTPAHRILTAMEKAGMVDYWLQQNHDGLAHRAGFPAAKINEIHGSWHDASNPVVKMSGNLRDDLFAAMLEWADRADLVFAVGTSFSGLNADRCAKDCSQRHLDRGVGQGLAVLTIQETPVDHLAALRIFSKIDPFMEIVRRKLSLTVDRKTYKYPNSKLEH